MPRAPRSSVTLEAVPDEAVSNGEVSVEDAVTTEPETELETPAATNGDGGTEGEGTEEEEVDEAAEQNKLRTKLRYQATQKLIVAHNDEWKGYYDTLCEEAGLKARRRRKTVEEQIAELQAKLAELQGK